MNSGTTPIIMNQATVPIVDPVQRVNQGTTPIQNEISPPVTVPVVNTPRVVNAPTPATNVFITGNRQILLTIKVNHCRNLLKLYLYL